MVNYCQDVRDFHDKFALVTPPHFTKLEQGLFEFRVKFFHEELEEYVDAYMRQDLATAIDSLIDLVYITCGCALLHGIDVPEFNKLVEAGTPEEMLFSSQEADKFTGLKPHLLTPENHQIFHRVLRKNIDDYILAFISNHEVGVKNALVSLYQNCLYGAYRMGFTLIQWNELWTDVQRANMAKERVLNAADSKRGSTWDVRKPAGWIPPRTEELVQKYLGAA